MATASTVPPVPVKRSDSDISPKTTVPRSDSETRGPKADYFSCDSNTVDGSNTSVRASDGDDGSSGHKSSVSFAADPPSVRSASLESNDNAGKPTGSLISRHSSISSVTFRSPKNPTLPQGKPQKMGNERIRVSSPAPASPACGFVTWSKRFPVAESNLKTSSIEPPVIQNPCFHMRTMVRIRFHVACPQKLVAFRHDL
ncbi:uncharacterized protein NECHADRAFT_81825 [Fusarium vanettenii 77-13-4]|uniref:Uncharacterized protein n=1 Tax=Fusarium vanettenii (strain ATCC MYA-4622 / CBS 123669 / FGSC 9596 / NRRL 45880 / 77-13-4) TaxID=660122 RepID=C7Z9P5_FUSV7|nr:uncharacterized protein NECHADRAFT_81825 [Fusarium vanettenii 77-13-4]EEU39539.1 hypothetical protein NECHADRAFT_81825 [Fusarium vanettenii 77-13-4]